MKLNLYQGNWMTSVSAFSFPVPADISFVEDGDSEKFQIFIMTRGRAPKDSKNKEMLQLLPNISSQEAWHILPIDI
jgi:hypothetical protein